MHSSRVGSRAAGRPVSKDVGMAQKVGTAPSSPNAQTPSVNTEASAGSSAVAPQAGRPQEHADHDQSGGTEGLGTAASRPSS